MRRSIGFFIAALAASGCADEVVTPPAFDAGTAPQSWCPECLLCGDMEAVNQRAEAGRSAFEQLTEGVSERPIMAPRNEATNGTLRIAINPNAVPIIVAPSGVFVAASQLGDGRVVAFSSQDFLSSGDRSTLLGEPGIVTLLANAVRWAAPVQAAAQPRVLAPNFMVQALLRVAGFDSVSVASVRFSEGLEEPRDWSADALDAVDVAVIQVNEWGTSHLEEDDVAAIRRFVTGGGGLLIAGSALHWGWWLHWTAAMNPGDAILEGTGISWSRRDVPGTELGRAVFDPLGSPAALWCAYIDDAELDAAQLGRLSPLFNAAADDGREHELGLGLERLLDETPRLPAAKASPQARLSADVAVLLGAAVWPRPHPWSRIFPGEVAVDAERVEAAVLIDTRWKRARPLGMYAAPGEVVRVRLPAAHQGTGLKIRLGELHDDLRSIGHIDRFARPPLLFHDFLVENNETAVGTGLGGSLYLLVPDDYPAASIEVGISGAVRQAVYRHGASSAADFSADLAGGAPLAIVEQLGKVRLVVTAEEARRATDLGAVMTFWTRFIDSHRSLSQEPAPRPYESDWIFDPQVGWGYANATSDRINHPKLATGWALRSRVGDEDWWLFAHELGHQFQTADWSGGPITEVAVNLFSMYTINSVIHAGGDRETVGFKDNRIDHAALASARWESADLFGKLELYRQLVFEFGWNMYRQVFASYYDPAFPRDRFGGFMDGFAARFSAVTQRDITPFLDHWEYPLSDEGRARVVAMNLDPWLPPGW